MATPRFADVITQFDGSSDFAEWVKKLELVAKLQKVNELENFLPLYLVGKAFAVYDSLSDNDKSDYKRLKACLLKAFSLDSFSAFEGLLSRRLQVGESVDVYLADLRRLVGLIGDQQELLKTAFVCGLPTEMKVQLKAATALGSMKMEEVAERARTISFEDRSGAISAVASRSGPRRNPSPAKRINCYRCGDPSHIARSCPTRKASRGCCFLCGEEGHFVAQCPKKEAKNE